MRLVVIKHRMGLATNKLHQLILKAKCGRLGDIVSTASANTIVGTMDVSLLARRGRKKSLKMEQRKEEL